MKKSQKKQLNLSEFHGERFKGIIKNTKVEGRVSVQKCWGSSSENEVYLCQENVCGLDAIEKFGYTFSWMLDEEVKEMVITPSDKRKKKTLFMRLNEEYLLTIHNKRVWVNNCSYSFSEFKRLYTKILELRKLKKEVIFKHRHTDLDGDQLEYNVVVSQPYFEVGCQVFRYKDFSKIIRSIDRHG